MLCFREAAWWQESVNMRPINSEVFEKSLSLLRYLAATFELKLQYIQIIFSRDYSTQPVFSRPSVRWEMSENFNSRLSIIIHQLIATLYSHDSTKMSLHSLPFLGTATRVMEDISRSIFVFEFFFGVRNLIIYRYLIFFHFIQKLFSVFSITYTSVLLKYASIFEKSLSHIICWL